MTILQSRKHALKVLVGWNRPPQYSIVTSNNGQTLTLQMLGEIMGVVRRNAPPIVSVLMSPQMIEQFAETSIDQSLYGTVRILADPTCPPNEAYMIQSPIPE